MTLDCAILEDNVYLVKNVLFVIVSKAPGAPKVRLAECSGKEHCGLPLH